MLLYLNTRDNARDDTPSDEFPSWFLDNNAESVDAERASIFSFLCPPVLWQNINVVCFCPPCCRRLETKSSSYKIVAAGVFSRLLRITRYVDYLCGNPITTAVRAVQTASSRKIVARAIRGGVSCVTPGIRQRF